MSKRFLSVGAIMSVSGLAVLTLMAACSSSDNPGGATSSYNARARKALSAKSAHREGDVKDMVAAVSATKNGAPVELRFNLAQKPEIGQPVDLSVALVPHAAGLDSVAVAFSGSEGLEIVEGAQGAPVEKPVDGTPVRYTVKLLPKQDGIYAVTAVVSVASANQTVTRNFAIPVIAGSGLPDLSRKTEGAKGS